MPTSVYLKIHPKVHVKYNRTQVLRKVGVNQKNEDLGIYHNFIYRLPVYGITDPEMTILRVFNRCPKTEVYTREGGYS